MKYSIINVILPSWAGCTIAFGARIMYKGVVNKVCAYYVPYVSIRHSWCVHVWIRISAIIIILNPLP